MKSILLATAAALSLSGAAVAQTGETATPSAGVDAAVSANVAGPTASPMGATAATTAEPTFTDDEVNKVALIAAETRRINADGQAKITAATTPEAKAAATTALQTSLREAVTNQGLTVERYNALATAAATDPALMARLSSATAAQGTSSPASTNAPDNPSE